MFYMTKFICFMLLNESYFDNLKNIKELKNLFDIIK